MNWQDHIHSDAAVLLGKPVIKGTRIAVEHVIGLLAQGWTEQQVLENYPRLSKTDLTAVFAYVIACMQDRMLISPLRRQAS